MKPIYAAILASALTASVFFLTKLDASTEAVSALAASKFPSFTIRAVRGLEGYDSFIVTGPDCYSGSFPYRNHAEAFIEECKTKQRVWHR